MKHIFIDAQIWLSLYAFSHNNLNQFSKLKDCIQNGEISIILTDQVCDEVFRNRENKLKDVLKQTQNISFNIPVLYQGYTDDHSQLQNALKKAQTLNAEMLKKINSDIVAQELPQDILIKELFALSTKLISTQSAVDKAVLRYRIIGNPPGKDDKCGDAITWEVILEQIEQGTDLFFISDDKDYKSVLNETRLNQFLQNEWQDRKKSKIFFYNSLPSFFSQHLTDIILETAKKQDDLIADLRDSSSFASTHSIIAKMRRFDNWSEKQIEQIAIIVRENSQVRAIILDDDVYNFLDNIARPLFLETESEDIIWLQHKLWDEKKSK